MQNATLRLRRAATYARQQQRESFTEGISAAKLTTCGIRNTAKVIPQRTPELADSLKVET